MSLPCELRTLPWSFEGDDTAVWSAVTLFASLGVYYGTLKIVEHAARHSHTFFFNQSLSNGQTGLQATGFEMCVGHSVPQVPAKTRLESSIKMFTPLCVDHCLFFQARRHPKRVPMLHDLGFQWLPVS